ncbi:hypothetical protein [Streptomyces sp. NPDC007904]|uniref:hypothetical protein n=1 Tax=Streptomyces sp. NPDC007904 TaxID=3364787 RepID=UPI0036E0749E
MDAGLADAATADPTHPRLPEPHHLLAYHLSLQGEMAIERFRLVDGDVNALPWRYRGSGATAHYRKIRNSSAQAVATVD